MNKMLCIDDYEKYALKNLPKFVAEYYKSGATHEETLKENRHAFSRLKIRPRFLRDVSNRDMSTTILGHRVTMPIAVSPTAVQRLAHSDGEIATVKACESTGTIMILAAMATSSIEEVAKAAPKAIKWFQLFIYSDRKVTERLVKRAESNGYSAIVLTIDTPKIGIRFNEMRNDTKLPSHLRMINVGDGGSDTYSVEKSPESDARTLCEYAVSLLDPSLTWNDVLWLKSITKLPIIAKGILTAEDALLAVDHGVSAILVSNHGGRQLDGVSATIDALPEVVRAVNNRCEVYIDGGIRSGTDVFKALALGANAVFVGRPILWGLSFTGENGAKHVLEILRNEFDIAMALSGCAKLKDITSAMIKRYDISKL